MVKIDSKIEKGIFCRKCFSMYNENLILKYCPRCGSKKLKVETKIWVCKEGLLKYLKKYKNDLFINSHLQGDLKN